MADRADPDERGALETLALAGIGALVLAADRADALADEVATRLGIDREDVRAALSDALDSWRREAHRVGERTERRAARMVGDLGVATRDGLAELELRVAQLEHRLKLLERSS